MKLRVLQVLRCVIVASFVAILSVGAAALVVNPEKPVVESSELVGANRAGEQTASRGAPRTDAADYIAAAANSDRLVAQADQDAATTSTTEAPATTTAAPTTTTTTVAPTTTTEAPKPKVTEVLKAKEPEAPKPSSGNAQSGQASYYSHKPGGCAHRTIPKGVTVTVTNTANGKTATCVVNDRGPFIAGRIVDLDTTVFKQIASTSAGVAPVRISW